MSGPLVATYLLAGVNTFVLLLMLKATAKELGEKVETSVVQLFFLSVVFWPAISLVFLTAAVSVVIEELEAP